MKPTCDYCRTGRYNGCPNILFYSSPPVDGTLRRYHVHPAAWLHKLPDNLNYEEGALLEPLSVALAGIERSGLRLGDPLVICGAGPIGIVTLLAANAAGAAPVVITDLDENRLKVAESLVPRVRTVQVQRDQDAHGVASSIKQALGQEAKLVMECTGVESSIHTAIYVRVAHHLLTLGTDYRPGNSVWRNSLRDRCRQQGFPAISRHACFVPRDRYPVSIPVHGDVSKGNHARLGGADRPEAACHASV